MNMTKCFQKYNVINDFIQKINAELKNPPNFKTGKNPDLLAKNFHTVTGSNHPD